MTCFVCRAHDIIATIINLFLKMCQRQQRPFHTKTSESVEESLEAALIKSTSVPDAFPILVSDPFCETAFQFFHQVQRRDASVEKHVV